MRFFQRSWGGLLAWLLGSALTASALAQQFPTRPITVVVPYPAGASGDVVARIIIEKARESLGQPMVVDNRTGAAGVIGTTLVARAAADGYTLLMATQSHTANPSLYRNISWDPVASFAPIALVGVIPNVLAVSTTSPYKTLQDFVARAKAYPGQLNYSSSGVGTSLHLTIEMFKQAAGIDLVHVPYKSDVEGFSALKTADVVISPFGIANVKPWIEAGDIRPLALSSRKRSALLPHVPTAVEAGFPSLEVNPWYAFLAPHGTPPAVVSRLNTAIVGAMKSPEVQAKLVNLGMELEGGTPADLERFLRNDTARWSKLIKDVGIRLE